MILGPGTTRQRLGGAGQALRAVQALREVPPETELCLWGFAAVASPLVQSFLPADSPPGHRPQPDTRVLSAALPIKYQ